MRSAHLWKRWYVFNTCSLMYMYTIWCTVSCCWSLEDKALKFTAAVMKQLGPRIQPSRRKEKKNQEKIAIYRIKEEENLMSSGFAMATWRKWSVSEKTTLDTLSAKCFSLFDYSSVEEVISVLKLMLAKNCYGIFRFGPSARGLKRLLHLSTRPMQGHFWPRGWKYAMASNLWMKVCHG